MDHKHTKAPTSEEAPVAVASVDLESQVDYSELEVEQTAPPPEVIYVVMPEENYYDYGNDPMIPCAIVGLLFSWIPLVGIITFCFNFDAPLLSVRYRIAQLALMVSILSLLFNVIFWPARS